MIKQKIATITVEFDTTEADTSTHLQGQIKDLAAVFESSVWWVIDVQGFNFSLGN